MATATQTSALNGRSLGERIANTYAAFTAFQQKRAMYRTTLRELGELNDRELNDLGLSRSSIRAIAYEAAYSK